MFLTAHTSLRPNSARTLLLAAILLPMVACAPSVGAPDAPGVSRVILVTPAPSGAWAGFWTAYDAGYFADEGIDLQVVPVADTTRVIPLVEAREAQFAAVDGQALIEANAGGANLRAIAAITNQAVASVPVGAGGQWPSVALSTTQTYIAHNPRIVTSMLVAYTRGIHRFKTDPEFANQILGKYLELDDYLAIDATRLALDATFDDVPHVTMTGVVTAIDSVAATQPWVDRSPDAYVDDSFVTRLEQAGAFDAQQTG